MKKPDFFIIGAPKCGTSTISHTLRAHPQVFVPLVFEPHFFSTDMNREMGRKANLNWYLDLFRDADETHLAVGEKSVSYLYSEEAISNILEFQPNARIIVCLRNPIEMAPSWHAEHVFNLVEDVQDFEAAWELQESRLEGHNIPPLNGYEFVLQYREMGLLGKYLQKLYTKIPNERVHLVFMDDIKQDFTRAHKELLDFLSLPFAALPERRKYQAHREHRSIRFAHMLSARSNTFGARALRHAIKLTGPLHDQLFYQLRELNKKHAKRKDLRPEVRTKLQHAFREDIALLSELTDRDLSHWK